MRKKMSFYKDPKDTATADAEVKDDATTAQTSDDGAVGGGNGDSEGEE